MKIEQTVKKRRSQTKAITVRTLYITVVITCTTCSDIQFISRIRDKSVTTQNLAFLSYWYRKKRLQMNF